MAYILIYAYLRLIIGPSDAENIYETTSMFKKSIFTDKILTVTLEYIIKKKSIYIYDKYDYIRFT